MPEERVVVTTDQAPQIERLINRLPAILAGQVPDVHGIARGFRSRIGWAFFSLVAPAFNRKGRGQADDAGVTWAPLSPQYLAYQRPVTGRKPPRGGGKAPGGNDGLLSATELRLWNQIFARSMKWLILRHDPQKAKAIAAGHAWNVIKELGGQTKLQKFGERKAGVDYQILVDTGRLRQSLTVGQVSETGPGAHYAKPRGQEFDSMPGRIVVGSNVKYAGYHHHGKGRRRRRFWPEQFPADWWQQILGVTRSGLVRIGTLFGGSGA